MALRVLRFLKNFSLDAKVRPFRVSSGIRDQEEPFLTMQISMFTVSRETDSLAPAKSEHLWLV